MMLLNQAETIKSMAASFLLATSITTSQEASTSIVSPSPLQQDVPFSRTITIRQSSVNKAVSPTENYLPRRLYPGTYGQFCGPTPEVEVKQSCSVHGWHGDVPIDKVDEACERHDIAYCKCEDELLSRRQAPKEDLPMLSSMTALRFATKPALTKTLPVDNQYFQCINKADREIIKTGIQVRSEMQRSGCSTDPSLAWFCELGQGTLGVFEKVNLDIFLKDLDFDEQQYQKVPLQELERKRQLDLSAQLKNGKNLAEAASSGPVKEDEQAMLQRLLGDE